MCPKIFPGDDSHHVSMLPVIKCIQMKPGEKVEWEQEAFPG